MYFLKSAVQRIVGLYVHRYQICPRLPEHVYVKMRIVQHKVGIEKHTRECFVVAEEGADLERIRREIVNMPNYFADYDTTVHFISEEELLRDHGGIPHGGMVLRSGTSASGSKFLAEFSLKLESNPEFTSGVLVAFARAVHRMHAEGKTGAVTAFDVAPKYLCPLSEAEQRKRLL